MPYRSDMFFIAFFTCIVIHTCTLCISISTDNAEDNVADVNITFTVYGDKCVSEHETVSCEISSDGEGRRVRISHAGAALTCQLNNSVSGITVKRRNVSRHRGSVTCSEYKRLLAELYSLIRGTPQIICLKCLNGESVTALVYAILTFSSTGNQSIYNSKATPVYESERIIVPLKIVSNGIQPPSRAVTHATQPSATSISGDGAVAEDQEEIPQTEKIRSFQGHFRDTRELFRRRFTVSAQTDASGHPDENSMRGADTNSPTATKVRRLRGIWDSSRRSDTTTSLSDNNDSNDRSKLHGLGRHPNHTATGVEVYKSTRDGSERAILSKIIHSHTSTYDVQTPHNDLSLQADTGISEYPTADGVQYKSTDSDAARPADGRSTDTRSSAAFAGTQRGLAVSRQTITTRRTVIDPARRDHHRKHSRSAVQVGETKAPSAETETSATHGYALRDKRAAGDGESSTNSTASDAGATHLYTHKLSSGVGTASTSTDSEIISGVTPHSMQPDFVTRSTEYKTETHSAKNTSVTVSVAHTRLTTGHKSTFPIIDILGKSPPEHRQETGVSTPTRDVEEVTTDEPIRRWVVTHPPFLLITALTAAGVLVWLSATLLVSLVRCVSSVHYRR